MKHLLHNNKRGLSEIVGYAILIVIAISLSVMVYSFLKVYVPKDKVECSTDINLIISSSSCSHLDKQLNITISNKGLFKVDAAYLRFGLESDKVKSQINQNNSLFFNQSGSPGLNPGEIFIANYTINSINSGVRYGLEIEPAMIKDKQIVLCDNAIITQPIVCS